MKLILSISALLFFSASVIGQREMALADVAPLQERTDMASDAQEIAWVAPAFPGGQAKLMKLISDGLTYPELAWENSIEGTVVLRLTIAADGAISNVDVLRSLGFGCDEAVLEQVGKLPPFKPGLIYGQGTESTFDVPVWFRLR
ncbi:energy transducer TonB [Neolewinella persica]|uniref:energy transducer TonB n=1 Tax=Neolewinella persica TaxID=70998 RepID=UPI0003A45A5E|nr:energy transducer TonB [Neolewinella persica]